MTGSPGAVRARLCALRDALGLALDDGALAAVAAASGGDPARVGVPHERDLARDPAARRAAAVYYTPPHLVALTVEETVGAAVAGAAGAPALDVLDPACGAGVFLVAALGRLEAAAVAAGGGAGPPLRAALAARLAGVDVDPTAVALARLAVALAVCGDADPRDVGADALGGAVAGIRVGDGLLGELPPADVVLGNPPWGQKRFALPPGRKAELRRRFRSAAGRTDPAALFVERALEVARPGGRWGFVLPDVVLLKQHEALRALLLERAAIELVAHAGRAFRGVGLDAVVIAGRAGAPPDGHRVRVWRAVPRDWRAAPPPARAVPQAMFAGLPGRRFNLHLDERAAAALARLAALPRLADDFDVHEGVHSGNRRARLFRAAPPDGPGAPLVVGGDELRAFRLRWDGRWIDLDPRAVDRAGGGYANLGHPDWFAAGKLVVRRTGDRLVAARDRAGWYVSNNAFVLVPHDGLADDDVDAWLAVLNGGFATAWFRAQVPRVGRAFAEVKIQDLAPLPRPPGDAWRAAVPGLARLARAAEARAAAGEAAALDATVAEIDAAVDAAFAAAGLADAIAALDVGAS